MPKDTNQTPTDHGMTLEEMQAMGALAEKIKRATEKLREAEDNLALLKKSLADKDITIKWSWNPEIILKKADRNSWGKDRTVRIKLPYGVVEQQLVDEVKRAKRELILLGGRP